MIVLTRARPSQTHSPRPNGSLYPSRQHASPPGPAAQVSKPAPKPRVAGSAGVLALHKQLTRLSGPPVHSLRVREQAQKDRGRPCASYTLPSIARAADVRDMLLFQRPERAFRLPCGNVLSTAWFLDSRSRPFVVNLRCSLRAFVGKEGLPCCGSG